MKKLTLLILAVITIAGTAMAVSPGKPWKHKGPMHGMKMIQMMEELDLTDEQKTRVADVLSKYRDEMLEIKNSFGNTRDAVKEAVLADNATEASIAAALEQGAAKRAKVASLIYRITKDVKPILTAEQLAFIKSNPKGPRGMHTKLPMLDLFIKAYAS